MQKKRHSLHAAAIFCIFFQLLFKRFQRRELPFVTNPGQKPYLQRQAVDIFIEIQNMRLNSSRSATDSGPCADIAHTPVLLAKYLNLNRIHPIGRHQLKRLVQLHISRRKTYCPPHTVPRHHHAIQPITVSQHGIGQIHIPRLQSLPNLGA